MNYYNEIDPFAAAWLQELINTGHLTPGYVDTRSIEDVKPNELAGFTQCHFFAGIGVWAYALRQAGWPDDKPVWTGSCPCQPFSTAGKSGGFDDERHLWPAWHWLISQCKPNQVFGEQVASKDGLGWLDLVQADMEGTGYYGGAVGICAAGVGAPHIRQRLWLAYAHRAGRSEQRWGREEPKGSTETGCAVGGLEHALGANERRTPRGGGKRVEPDSCWRLPEPAGTRAPSRLADTEKQRSDEGQPLSSGGRKRVQPEQGAELVHDDDSCGSERPSPTNGLWGDADWLACRDGKWRAVEPGTFPLVNGATNRVGRLRGYGNAINAEVAKTFIKSYMEVTQNV